MSKKRRLPYGVHEEIEMEHRKPPQFIVWICIMLTVFAGLGDWKTLNSMLGGLPKVVSAGVIGIAFLYFLVEADFDNVKETLSYLPMYMSLILALMLWSLVIWVMNFTALSSVTRGASKMIYQTVTVIYAVSMCYLFAGKAVNYFFYSMCITNGLIMLLEIPSYGLGPSISSLIQCIITFGDAEGYVRQLEIHDITFLFGQFMIYYAAFAPRETKSERMNNYRNVFLSLFFMLVGLKRSAIPAAIMFSFITPFFVKRKHIYRWVLFMGIGMVGFFWLYLYLVHSGIFSEIMNTLGVDMMGRDYIWRLANDYYEFSPMYMGLGFEAVDSIVSGWYHAGILNHAYPFHNDILKVFVETGFVGFNCWSLILYIYYPFYWNKRNGGKVALVYIMLLAYMSVTYLTDNSAFYFWDSVGLRLIPLSYAFGLYRKKKREKWRPPTCEDTLDAMWTLEQDIKHRNT